MLLYLYLKLTSLVNQLMIQLYYSFLLFSVLMTENTPCHCYFHCHLKFPLHTYCFLELCIWDLWQIFWAGLILNCFAVSTSCIALKFSERWGAKVLDNYNIQKFNTRPAKLQGFIVRFTVLTWISWYGTKLSL